MNKKVAMKISTLKTKINCPKFQNIRSAIGMTGFLALALWGMTVTAQVEDQSGLEAKTSIANIIPSNYRLVWSDEFNGTTLDTSHWNYVNQAWPHNSELEYYTKRRKNVRVENGYLVIEAHKESYKNRDYTSGRIHTSEKQTFKYGIVIARIKLPSGKGLWPAFWMMGDNRYHGGGWPGAGEIDIMENKGSQAKHVSGALHATGYHSHGDYYSKSSLQGSFHEYAIVWDNGTIHWYVDGNIFETRTRSGWVFDSQPFFILLNLAVGGHFDGNPTDSTQFPAQMIVDWVRIYQP